ncbi:MAG TPA: hypothetical protein VMI12_12550 [Puia sp.]|nr:hypothetical protein [Puia sp.]
MKRSLLAIIFISSLVFYQYGRVLNYIGCRINNIAGNSSQCDCEKQVRDGTNTDTQPFSQKLVIKTNTDDLFFRHYNSLIPFTVFPAAMKISFSPSYLTSGFDKNIFQPPRA